MRLLVLKRENGELKFPLKDVFISRIREALSGNIMIEFSKCSTEFCVMWLGEINIINVLLKSFLGCSQTVVPC